MTAQKGQFSEYILPIARTSKVWVDNVINDDLGQAVLRLHNEQFKGVDQIADTPKYKPNQPLSFSNVPRILSYDQILRELTNNRIRVLSLAEVIQHWDAIPDKPTTYADTNSITVFPNAGPNEDLRQRVLDIIERQRTEVPLLIAGLGVEKANNEYNFTFTRTDYTQVTEVPFLTQDGKLAYNPREGIIQAAEGVSVWTPSDQSGLRRAYRNRDDNLNVRNDRLLNSKFFRRKNEIANGRIMLAS